MKTCFRVVLSFLLLFPVFDSAGVGQKGLSWRVGVPDAEALPATV